MLHLSKSIVGDPPHASGPLCSFVCVQKNFYSHNLTNYIFILEWTKYLVSQEELFENNFNISGVSIQHSAT